MLRWIGLLCWFEIICIFHLSNVYIYEESTELYLTKWRVFTPSKVFFTLFLHICKGILYSLYLPCLIEVYMAYLSFYSLLNRQTQFEKMIVDKMLHKDLRIRVIFTKVWKHNLARDIEIHRKPLPSNNSQHFWLNGLRKCCVSHTCITDLYWHF